MKKTTKTVLTAAMFAAALNAVPSGTVSGAEDENNNGMYGVYGPPLATTMVSETTTTEPFHMTAVYGPPIAWESTTSTVPASSLTTTTAPVSDELTTSITRMSTVYGPPIAWDSTTLPLTTTTEEFIPVPVYGPPVAWRKGDIDNSGKIDVFDMIAMRKLYTDGVSSDGAMYRADLNGDGNITVADMVMLSRYLLGDTDNISEPLPTTSTTYLNTQTKTETTTEPVPQPEYGPPVAFDE